MELLELDYVIGGSFASTVWGQPRQTNDLDFVLSLNVTTLHRFASALPDSYSFDVRSAEETLNSTEEYRSFQFYHLPTMFKFDVFVPLEEPFVTMALKRRVKVQILPDVGGYVCSPEDIVIQKLRWFVLGNRVSDRQWTDIVQVLEIQAPELDVAYMRAWAEQFGLTDLLLQAMGEAGM